MTLFGWIVVTLILLLVSFVLAGIIKHNLKLKHISNSFKTATEDELKNIYQSIQSKSVIEATAAILAKTNIEDCEKGVFKLTIPKFLKPWANRSIQADGTENIEINFTLNEESYDDYIIKGKKYQLIKVPRLVTKTGKGRNQYSPRLLLSKNEELKVALNEVCEKYPLDLLTFLLNAGSDSFEDGFQVRFGGSPAWVQGSNYQNCNICKKRMSLIVQLPGELLPHVTRNNGTFFFFGCEKHPEQTKTTCQFT